MTAQEIKELLDKYPFTPAKEIRPKVESVCKEYGIKIKSTHCGNCLHDALKKAYNAALRVEGATEKGTKEIDGVQYLYTQKNAVVVNGFGLVGTDTPTAKIQALKRLFPRLFRVLFTEVPTPPVPIPTEEEIKAAEAPTETGSDAEAEAPAPTAKTHKKKSVENADNNDA